MPNDNVDVTAGAFTEVIAADDIGNVKYQRVKSVFGDDGEWSDIHHESPLPVIPMISRDITRMISRFLDSVGDGSGVKNGNIDYSVGTGTPGSLMIKPPATKLFNLTEMIFQIRTVAASSGALNSTAYGDIVALTEGICVQVTNDASIVKDLFDGEKVRTNEGWFQIAELSATSTALGGDAVITGKINFLEAWKMPIRLDGSQNQKLELKFADDLSGLRGHRFHVKGWMENVPL